MSLLPHLVVWLHGTTVPVPGVVGLYITTVPISGVVGLYVTTVQISSVIELYVTTACANIWHYVATLPVSAWCGQALCLCQYRALCHYCAISDVVRLSDTTVQISGVVKLYVITTYTAIQSSFHCLNNYMF